MRSIRSNPLSIEYKIIDSCAKEIYKNFYRWMLVCYKKDELDIEEKDLEFLKKSYKEIGTILNYRSDDTANDICLMRFNMRNTENFKNYIDDTKEEYEFLDNINNEDKQYRHYNRLLSWYTITPETIDKVIKNLLDKQNKHVELHYDKVFNTYLDIDLDNDIELLDFKVDNNMYLVGQGG